MEVQQVGDDLNDLRAQARNPRCAELTMSTYPAPTFWQILLPRAAI